MTTITAIITAIKAAGYQVAHDSFSSPQALPFVCWTDEGSNSLYADNICYLTKSVYNVELYTKYKSKADEKKIQDALNAQGVTYSRNPTTKIDSEDCFQTVFIFELID
jgi:hypothetical protein